MDGALLVTSAASALPSRQWADRGEEESEPRLKIDDVDGATGGRKGRVGWRLESGDRALPPTERRHRRRVDRGATRRARRTDRRRMARWTSWWKRDCTVHAVLATSRFLVFSPSRRVRATFWAGPGQAPLRAAVFVSPLQQSPFSVTLSKFIVRGDAGVWPLALRLCLQL